MLQPSYSDGRYSLDDLEKAAAAKGGVCRLPHMPYSD